MNEELIQIKEENLKLKEENSELLSSIEYLKKIIDVLLDKFILFKD